MWKNKFRALWKFQRQLYMQKISLRIRFCKGKNLTHHESLITKQKLRTKGCKRPWYLGGVDRFPKVLSQSYPRHSTKTVEDTLHQPTKEMILFRLLPGGDLLMRNVSKEKERSLGFHRGRWTRQSSASLPGVMMKDGVGVSQNKQEQDGPLW